MKPGPLARWVAILAAGAFLWTVTLSVSPSLHQRIHAGQSSADHSCAVTFVGAGNYLHPTTTGLNDVEQTSATFTTVPELNPRWVPSPFLCGAVFEHAPPSFS